MTTKRKLMTAEDLSELPDDGFHRYELVDGVLIEMTPPGERHGTLMAQVVAVLWPYVESRNLGRLVAGDPGYILHRRPDTVRGPDVAFTSRERLEAPPAGGYATLVPDLVVEIVSPGDRPGEVQAKIAEWLAAGVRLVWVFYPATRSIVAHRGPAEVRTYANQDMLVGAPVFPDFACPVARFFQDA